MVTRLEELEVHVLERDAELLGSHLDEDSCLGIIALSEVGEFATNTLGGVLTVACARLPLEYPPLLLGSETAR